MSKRKLKKLLENKNFRNSQNYIVDFRKKIDYIKYGNNSYTVKKGFIKEKVYNIKSISTGNNRTKWLYRGEIGYIILSNFKVINYLYKLNWTFIFGVLFLIQFIIYIFYGGEVIINSEKVNLNSLPIKDRFLNLGLFLIMPIVFIIIGLYNHFFSTIDYYEYLIFKEKANSIKIFIYKYK